LTSPAGADPTSTPAVAGVPGAGVLDAEALARLQELDPSGKAGLLPRVLSTYALSLERQLGMLHSARLNADAHGQRHVAHTLKSSSASVGALKLSALCADIEGKLRDGEVEGLDAQLDALTLEAARILAALRHTLPPSP
jgi:HPt (histidine-containing phosphotransfer) domain-containing protein